MCVALVHLFSLMYDKPLCAYYDHLFIHYDKKWQHSLSVTLGCLQFGAITNSNVDLCILVLVF
jgi:hypothetical protein